MNGSVRCDGCTNCHAEGVMMPYKEIALCPRCMKHPERAYIAWRRRQDKREHKAEHSVGHRVEVPEKEKNDAVEEGA